MTKKIFKSIMLVCAVVATVGLAFVLGILYRYFGNQITTELAKEAAYLSQGVEEQGVSFLEKLKEQDSRITYIDSDGTVLFDNKADVSSMDNHSDREEFKKAQEYGSGSTVRTSHTLAEKTIYYALRLPDRTVLRISNTQYSVLALVGEMILPFCWLLFFILILSGIFASRLSKSIVEPVNQLDLEHPEDNQIYEELSPLLGRIHKQNLEIQNQLDMAKQQQDEFTIITENMQEGLVLIDRYTMILSANSSAWKLFQAEETRLGQCVYCLDRSEDFRKSVERVLSGVHNERILKLNGNDIQLIANPVIRKEKVEGAVLLMVNVTEKMERENLRREFSANVSHELKTPLTSISGFSEILQHGCVNPEDTVKFAGMIYKEAQRLIQLIEDVIQLSRLDEEEVSHKWEEVEVSEICKSVIDMLSEKARDMKVHMYIRGAEVKLCTVKPLLEEILYNLCDNGIKYNKNNGSVGIYLEDMDNEVQITVADTGIGISPEDQNRVFERFYRADKSHSKEIEGTGLGLSIVKHAVTYLQGTVTLRSEEGSGTEIILKLPKKHKEI